MAVARSIFGDERFVAMMNAYPLGAGAAALPAGAVAFCASVGRLRPMRIVKFATRRWSRGLRLTLPDVISISSGLTSHGLLLPRLRSNSDTRSLDCAMPCRVTV